jgi:hypothetical protein
MVCKRREASDWLASLRGGTVVAVCENVAAAAGDVVPTMVAAAPVRKAVVVNLRRVRMELFGSSTLVGSEDECVSWNESITRPGVFFRILLRRCAVVFLGAQWASHRVSIRVLRQKGDRLRRRPLHSPLQKRRLFGGQGADLGFEGLIVLALVL